jgi:hypothetical protein
MGKKTAAQDWQDKLGNFGSNLKTSETKLPIQKTVSVETKINKKQEIETEETKFTVHLPTPLMDSIKEIGFKNKKKIKTMFVEALEKYVSENT